MFKQCRLRLTIMLNPTINPIIIRLMHGFHLCHYHLPGAVDGMVVVITVVGTVEVMAAGMAAVAGITDLII